MSSNQPYHPRSPDLTGNNESQKQPLPRLNRLPSYQIEEPKLPRGFSFSPRGSYDASPFFSQNTPAPSTAVLNQRPDDSLPTQSSEKFCPTTLPDQSPAFSPVNRADTNPRFAQGATSFQPLPFSNPYSHQQSPYASQLTADDMARLRARKHIDYNENHNGDRYAESDLDYQQPMNMHQTPHQPQHPSQPQFTHPFTQQLPPHGLAPPMPLLQQQQDQYQPPPSSHLSQTSMPSIDVKTKFPVARIKRIMQADEDVGKVAQATPTAVSKALESFMIALVSKGAAEATKTNSKRVTASHLKDALMSDPQFDFLHEICQAFPDEGGKNSKSRSKSEAKSEDSSEDMGGPSKRKGKGSRKRKSGDDEGSD